MNFAYINYLLLFAIMMVTFTRMWTNESNVNSVRLNGANGNPQQYLKHVSSLVNYVADSLDTFGGSTRPYEDGGKSQCHLGSCKHHSNLYAKTVQQNDKYQIIPTKNQLIYYNKSKLEKFQFQKVFDDNTTQSSIFEHVAVPILDKYLSGTNGTIFAYGQTGSGKSHTIYGSREDEGIIPRSLKYLFDNKLSIQSTDERNIFSMAYFEIYNETVYNLLKSPKNRKKSNVNFNNLGPDNAVRFTVDKNGDVTFKNLNIIRIKNVSQAFKQLISGNTRRQVSSTFLNHKSSRSHCICRIEYVNWRKGEKSNKTVLNLVDLAGSECISKLNNDKKTIVESKYINLSLMHLHQVDLNGDDEGHSVNCEPQTVVVHNDDSAEGIIADKESGENSCMELVLVNKNCGDQMTK
ncbi:kinesin-like protein KIF6, partial [Myzus persicae]|uniref:kinesin-like protein KIF6 n=1 Tax=Myzus persicae TaxID=13164 RepID=UPI000B930AA3